MGLDADAPRTLYELTLGSEPVALVLGSEGAGLSPLAAKRCDALVSVPQHGRIPSLNVAVAGAIACFDIARRRERGRMTGPDRPSRRAERPHLVRPPWATPTATGTQEEIRGEVSIGARPVRRLGRAGAPTALHHPQAGGSHRRPRADRGDTTVRFMMLMLPNIPDGEWMPSAEAVAAMTEYNEELSKAGVLLELSGLHPPSEGARVSFAGGKSTVTDGPFTEAKEVVGGYWLIDVKSPDEAVEWATRCPPVDERQVIEVRQIMEMEEFPPDVQAAAGR